jgi:hypothetical protein
MSAESNIQAVISASAKLIRIAGNSRPSDFRILFIIKPAGVRVGGIVVKHIVYAFFLFTDRAGNLGIIIRLDIFLIGPGFQNW